MQDRKKRIVFVGYMFSGKSTVGRKLAAKLGYKFIDTDWEIEEKFHYTIYNIFERFGEEIFRKMEKDMLRNILERDNVVIATGGGLPCCFDNMQQIKEKAFSIYLKADVNQIISRQKQSKLKRPLLKNKSEEEIREYIQKSLQEREQYYMQADIIVPSLNADVNQILALIEENI